MIKTPREKWEHELSTVPQHFEAKLSFMSEEHHQVRYFVVRELHRVGEPLSPEFIAQKLNLPIAQVNVILVDLEKHLVFLFRNEQGAVAWAYPVTVDKTPHHVTFSTGEQLYAA
jgi:hypothetical protein